MSQKDRHFAARIAAVALLLLAIAAVAVSYRVGQTRAAPSISPGVLHTVIQPACPSSISNVPGDYTKIADMGTFEVEATDSLVEVTFHGRIYASATNGTGVQFELRVDDAASTAGRIRGVLRSGEVTAGNGSSVSMGGFFEGLAPGTHTVSMWARTGGGGSDSDNVMYDPGCWSSDHVTVKEYLPFGSVAIPAVLRD
jgi:hypothetical protein